MTGAERRAARRAAAAARRAARMDRQAQRQGFLSGVIGEDGIGGIVEQFTAQDATMPAGPTKQLDGPIDEPKMDINKLLPILAVVAAFMFLKKK